MASQNTTDQRGSLANRAVREVYPVSRIVREARMLLEGSFPLIWVEGEISNLAMPGSGHIYFTLKDEAAQVRCAMFRNRNRQLRFTPENGMQVLLRVRVTLYEGRGEFQLMVEHMEEAGSGALQRAYEALKQRLGQEGLFDQAHKKPIPAMPATIGIISSPDGAAVHDILSVLKRRFPAVDVILYPVAVQGEASARQLVEAVRLADSRQECDVLIISRGGGSLEDLWSFNDEQLARAIYDCKLPVISAVGHEVDFTIADFVADVRAPTPSAAAEMAVPDARQLLATVQNLMQRLTARTRQWLTGEQRHLLHLQRRLPRPDLQIRQQNQAIKQYKRMLDAAWQRDQQNRAQRVDFLAARLKHPQAQIDSQRARLDNLMHRLQTALRSQQKQAAQSVVALQSRLRRQLPAQQVARQQLHLSGLKRQLDKLIQTQLSIAGSMLSQQVRTLAAVSPLNTLERGYSISRRIDTEEVITRSEQVRPGDAIRVKLRQGEIDCEVRAVKDK
ncbi:exodeoxyribonuclease VII large subunit [Methylophaga sp.]|uniref:exodeoxyribonuclease VII large subunit n=1 Tax=Methylophaga sp. TaxID=2024840 RepID=UPI0014008D10|nr:exodeoxyribonuclease VII large subunit [Methylophaga sp.]MTI63373.1 exodeoxyribonuclease VII large subunit [Methylophaga sp.]